MVHLADRFAVEAPCRVIVGGELAVGVRDFGDEVFVAFEAIFEVEFAAVGVGDFSTAEVFADGGHRGAIRRLGIDVFDGGDVAIAVGEGGGAAVGVVAFADDFEVDGAAISA